MNNNLDLMITFLPPLDEKGLLVLCFQLYLAVAHKKLDEVETIKATLIRYEVDPVTFVDCLWGISMSVKYSLLEIEDYSSGVSVTFKPFGLPLKFKSESTKSIKEKIDAIRKEWKTEVHSLLLDLQPVKKSSRFHCLMGEGLKTKKIGKRECPVTEKLSTIMEVDGCFIEKLFEELFTELANARINLDTLLNNRQWAFIDFRSKSEIKIAEALEDTGVLFYVNAKCRITTPEGRKTKESDFLVCHEGRWGILECDGENWHQSAAKDHERDDCFNAHGVWFVRRYSATECFNHSSRVVQSFLERMYQFYTSIH